MSLSSGILVLSSTQGWQPRPGSEVRIDGQRFKVLSAEPGAIHLQSPTRVDRLRWLAQGVRGRISRLLTVGEVAAYDAWDWAKEKLR